MRSVVVDALLFLGLVLLEVLVVVLQPVGEGPVVYLMREDLALEVISVSFYPCLVLLVQLHTQLWLFLLVVQLKSHSVEVQSLSRSQVDIVTLLGECVFNGLLARQLLVADLDEKPYHLADLVVDEALAHESKPYEGHSMRLAFLLIAEAFLEVLVDDILLDQFCPHGDDEPIASRIIGLVSLGEVVEVVSAEVESDQMIQLRDYLFPLQFVQHPLGLVILLTQK